MPLAGAGLFYTNSGTEWKPWQFQMVVRLGVVVEPARPASVLGAAVVASTMT